MIQLTPRITPCLLDLLDVVATLTAILKGPDAGKLTPEQAYAATQSALCLLGIENDHMAQERRKRVLINVNPALKSTAEEENVFQQAAPMLFGEEFAKKATERVEAMKAIKKITYSKPEEKHQSCFSDTTDPRNQQDGRGGGFKSGCGRFQLYQPKTKACSIYIYIYIYIYSYIYTLQQRSHVLFPLLMKCAHIHIIISA